MDSSYSRRQFLAASALGLGGAAAPELGSAAEQPQALVCRGATMHVHSRIPYLARGYRDGSCEHVG